MARVLLVTQNWCFKMFDIGTIIERLRINGNTNINTLLYNGDCQGVNVLTATIRLRYFHFSSTCILYLKFQFEFQFRISNVNLNSNERINTNGNSNIVQSNADCQSVHTLTVSVKLRNSHFQSILDIIFQF